MLVLAPVLFAAVGAVAGAAGAGLSALGLNQWFLRQVDEKLQPGRAALFVVSGGADPERAIEALAADVIIGAGAGAKLVWVRCRTAR